MNCNKNINSEISKTACKHNFQYISEPIINHYYFNLKNQNAQLGFDLTIFRNELEAAIQKILAGGNTGHSYCNVNWIHLIILSKHSFELKAEISYPDDSWTIDLVKYFTEECITQLKQFYGLLYNTHLFQIVKR